MKAIVIAPLANANAVLPPMDGDGTHLTYLVDGVRTGGFTLVGNVPMPDVFTCLVLVHTSPETVEAMADSGDYVFVEEVMEDVGALLTSEEFVYVEPDPEIITLDAPNPPPELPGPAALRIWLIQQGYSPSIVARTIPNEADEILAGLQELHQVSKVEYARAWQ